MRIAPDKRGSGQGRIRRDPHKLPPREKLVSFAAFIRELGRDELSDENARLLIRMFAGLTTREVYDSWIQNSTMAPFFKQPTWEEKENREKFTEYAVATWRALAPIRQKNSSRVRSKGVARECGRTIRQVSSAESSFL